jgi:hypothetical protein
MKRYVVVAVVAAATTATTIKISMFSAWLSVPLLSAQHFHLKRHINVQATIRKGPLGCCYIKLQGGRTRQRHLISFHASSREVQEVLTVSSFETHVDLSSVPRHWPQAGWTTHSSCWQHQIFRDHGGRSVLAVIQHYETAVQWWWICGSAVTSAVAVCPDRNVSVWVYTRTVAMWVQVYSSGRRNGTPNPTWTASEHYFSGCQNGIDQGTWNCVDRRVSHGLLMISAFLELPSDTQWRQFCGFWMKHTLLSFVSVWCHFCAADFAL